MLLRADRADRMASEAWAQMGVDDRLRRAASYMERVIARDFSALPAWRTAKLPYADLDRRLPGITAFLSGQTIPMPLRDPAAGNPSSATPLYAPTRQVAAGS